MELCNAAGVAVVVTEGLVERAVAAPPTKGAGAAAADMAPANCNGVSAGACPTEPLAGGRLDKLAEFEAVAEADGATLLHPVTGR